MDEQSKRTVAVAGEDEHADGMGVKVRKEMLQLANQLGVQRIERLRRTQSQCADIALLKVTKIGVIHISRASISDWER